MIYRGEYLNNDVKSKNLQLHAANVNTEVTQNDIILQITQAYFNILLAKEAVFLSWTRFQSRRLYYPLLFARSPGYSLVITLRKKLQGLIQLKH